MENGQRKQMFDLEEGEEWYDYSDDDGYGLDMDGEENWASESPARVLDPWAHLDVNKMGDDGSMHYGGDERESPVHAGDVSLSGPEEAPDLGLFEPLIRGDDEDDPRAILTSPDDVPSAVITGDALQPIENSPEQPIKIILQEKLQSAMEHITKLKGVYSQDRMLQNVPLIYVPPGQREEYNTLLEQLHPACMDLDLKLPVYFAVVEKEDVVRRLIIIIQTTIHQRMMLFSGSTRFLVTLDTLRTMFQQVLNMSEGIDSMMSGFSFPEDPSHAQSLHTSDSEDQEYGSSDDARSIHSDPSSRHLPLIKEWDRFWTSHLVGIDKSALSGAVIKYLDELERSPDEAFENEPHGIDINLLEVFPSPETVDVLRWLLFSAERLHWTQLADAIAFQGWGRNIYDPSLRNSNTDDIVLCLKSFLAQNHVLSTSLDNSGTPPNAFVVRSRNRPPPIVFAPSPAQQRTTIPPFNHTYDLNPGSSHRFIAIRSIRYLLHFTDHPLDSTTLHKYPLAVYASKYWCHHLLHCDDPTDLLEDAMCLLDDDSGPFIALNHLRTGGSRGKIDWYLPPVSPLCVCSEEGYADGVRALLERGARVDGDYNALLAALRGGHIEIEELLLANGGDLSKILVVQDIDGKSIYLLRKDCMSWEFFFRRLVEQEPQALQYIVNNQTVVRLKEGWKQLNSHNWEEWIFSVLGSRQPEIMLCMIRRDTCCAQSTEDKNGRCVNCGTQFVEDEPENWVPDALTFISAQDKTSSSTPGPKNGAAHDNNSSNRTTPMSPSADITVSASATPPESSGSLLTADVSVLSSSVESTVAGPEAEPVTTSISFAPSNSVMSRRRPKDLLYSPPSQDTAEQLRMEALSPKGLSLRRITTLYLGQWFAQVINCVRTVYVFMIAPPFLRINGEWNAQRLENRLKAFETWVWAANAALLAVAAAFLTLSTVASSTIPQSFLILSGIFSLFGFMYTVSLAFHMGDCKTDFAHWFHRHRNWRHTSRSLWNLSIMLSLPLTWMAWAFVNLGFFVISIGVQNLMFDVRENHSHGGQLPGATTLDIVDTPDPSFTSFAILQLVLFTVASVWSCIYAFKIYIEIDNYGKCLRPKRQHSSLVERGIEQDVSVGRT